jgi:hypothetical protein
MNLTSSRAGATDLAERVLGKKSSWHNEFTIVDDANRRHTQTRKAAVSGGKG